METAPDAAHPTRIERDAILTGLRMLQESLLRNDLRSDFVDILTNGGTHNGINAEQIGKLCEMLNKESTMPATL